MKYIQNFKLFEKTKLADNFLNDLVYSFGTTNKINLAGYITPDGDFLNFSTNGKTRDIDHRDLFYYLSDDYFDMIYKNYANTEFDKSYYGVNFIDVALKDLSMIRLGIARLHICTKPTDQQYKSIRKYLSYYQRKMEDLKVFICGDDLEKHFDYFIDIEEIIDYIKTKTKKLK